MHAGDMATASSAETQRRCVSCGRAVDWNADVCPRCGRELPPESQVARPPKSKIALWKVAAVAVPIVVVVVLASVLYVLSLGFGSCCSSPGVQVLSVSSFENGFKIELSTPTSDVVWSDLTIRLSDETDTVSWTNLSSKALTGAYPPEVWHYGNGKALPGLCVFLNVTDVSANGRMSKGDYITLTVGGGSLEPGADYTLSLLFEPTGGEMMAYDFIGQLETPGINILGKSGIAGGVKLEFTMPTAEVRWSDMTIQLYNGWNTVLWSDFTTASLTSSSAPCVWTASGPNILSGLEVYLNITDLMGDGRVGNGDYITFQSPAPGMGAPITEYEVTPVYSLTLLYEPTGGLMLSWHFVV